jgi:hypothetical protein
MIWPNDKKLDDIPVFVESWMVSVLSGYYGIEAGNRESAIFFSGL